MIQVDPTNTERTYVSLTDPRRKLQSAHEVVYGLTPAEVLRVIRDAMLAEMRRRAVQPQAEVA